VGLPSCWNTNVCTCCNCGISHSCNMYRYVMPVTVSSAIPEYIMKRPVFYCVVFIYPSLIQVKLLRLPLALQPTVGFGLSNNILPFFPYLSPTLSIIVKSIQLFLCLTFVTISFLLCGAPHQTPNLEDQGIHFCLGHHPLTR
jgi:hypothetical protein